VSGLLGSYNRDSLIEMDYRLDRHLHTSAQKQKVSLWSSLIKNGLQLAILALVAVGFVVYYAQVAGLKFVYDHDGNWKGMQFLRLNDKDGQLLPAFERDKCRELLAARDKARDEVVMVRGEHAAMEESLKSEKMTNKELQLQNEHLKTELEQRGSEGRQSLALSTEVARTKEKMADMEEEKKQSGQVIDSLRAELAETKQEVERLKAERDQYKTQVVQTEATLRKDSSEKEALLMDERTQLKEELEAARARCLSERAQLEADVDRLRNSTKDGESTTHHLQDALRDAEQAKEVAESELERVRAETAETVQVAGAERDELKAKTLQLEPKVKKLEATVAFLTSQTCPPPAADGGVSGAEVAEMRSKLAETEAALALSRGKANPTNRTLPETQLHAHHLRRGMAHWGDSFAVTKLARKLLGGRPASVAVLSGEEEATVATREHHYLAKVLQWLRDTFPDALHQMHPVTPPEDSSLGYMNICLGAHLPEEVDLVILEYAAHNNRSNGHTLRMYERLVRKVLQHPSQPAVLLVQTFAWRRPDARSYPGLPVTAFFESPEDDFGAVAKYYSLPSVSLRDAVFHDALKGTIGFKMKDFLSDCDERGGTCTSLNARGHGLLSELVVHRLSGALDAALDPASAPPSLACMEYPRVMLASRSLDPSSSHHSDPQLALPSMEEPPPKKPPRAASPDSSGSAEEFDAKLGEAKALKPLKQRAPPEAKAPKEVPSKDIKIVDAELDRLPRRASREAKDKERDEPGRLTTRARATGLSDSPLRAEVDSIPRPDGVSRRAWRVVTKGTSSNPVPPSEVERARSASRQMAGPSGTRVGSFGRAGRTLLISSMQGGREGAEKCALAVPPPMFPGNWGAEKPQCIREAGFKPLIKENTGWEYTVEASGDDNKQGWAAFRPGVVLDLQLDTTAAGGAKSAEVQIAIGYLKSLEHMGKASVQCTEGCSCRSADGELEQGVDGGYILNAHGAPSKNGGRVFLAVTQNANCVLRLASTNETESDGHKFKLTSVLVSEYSGDAGNGFFSQVVL